VARTLRFGSMLLSEIPDDLVQAVAQSSEHEAMMRAIGAHSAILVPLVARGQALGVLSFSRTTAARHYDSRDLQTAEELAHRAAIALENARLYRELQDSNRLKDEFLGIVSHELRTPLNAVLGWTQVLRRGRVDPEQAARALEAIDRNARAQAQLVDDLLDTSRVISGKLRIDIKPIDVGPVVESAVESFKPAARARGVELEAHIAPGTPRVAADAGRFQQIIGNLLSNALKFTPPGGRVVTTVIPSGPQVEVRVTDTGIGIAADFLPFVFDRFRQADSTTTRRHGGLGIGLAIVRHLVDLHGGTIRAESGGENQGSTFVVLLPAAPAGVPGEGGPSDLSVRPSLEDRGEPSAT
jgi:signal transduction histidine kinase